MLDWLGKTGDDLVRAFRANFNDQPSPFGSVSKKIGGVSDGNEGVQWNAWYDPTKGQMWVGVNLEGMKYNGWPIARLIVRELEHPTLPKLARETAGDAQVTIRWMRDYWQVNARPPIVERYITPSPLLLGDLDQSGWERCLLGGLDCLDERRDFKGRAELEVTLASSGSKVVGEVSPHLTFMTAVQADADLTAGFSAAKRNLAAVYGWTLARSAG